MKVKLLWYADVEQDEYGETEREITKNILNADVILPNARIMGRWCDGRIDVECYVIIEAKDLTTLLTELDYYTSFHDLYVWGIFDLKSNRLFTEQELEGNENYRIQLNMIEYCPVCLEILEHIDLKGENVYGCEQCKKEINRDNAIKFLERLEQLK